MYKPKNVIVLSLLLMLISYGGSSYAQEHRARVSAAISAQATKGKPFEALILLADSEAATPGANSRPDGSISTLNREAYANKIRERQEQLENLKVGLLVDTTDLSELEVLSDYSVLPIMHIRIHTQAQLDRLARDPRVRAIEEIVYAKTSLTQSLPLIGQPAAAASGFTGAGTSVCVLDTGLDYTRSAFGGCTANGSGQPTGSNCKVAYVQDFATNDNALDDNAGQHGTNVAGVVSGVAPGAKIIGLDVFAGGSASSADITGAINWCISNKAVYNIVSLNMSLGGNVSYPSPVSTADSAWGQAMTQAKNSGISVIAASGNEAKTAGISLPAAFSDVVSVGAVYDTNIGGVSWQVGCTDDSTAADKVTCFSNSAYYLSLLAPGAMITAAGITQGGTSQASPHVAGAWAVIKQKAPTATVNEVLASLTASGVPVWDARNGITKPRISVSSALGAVAPGVSYTLTVATTGAGTGTVTSAPTGINCGASCGSSFASGTALTLTATPTGSSIFTGWSGACSGTGTCSVTMSAARSVTATFAVGTTVTPINQSNLSEATGSTQRFSVVVPAGATNLVIQTNGGTGDVDLYVRASAEPSLSVWDCRPYANGNNEACTFPTPLASTYYILLDGFSAYGGVSLTVSYTAAALTNSGVLNFTSSNLTVMENAGNATVTVTRTGGSDGAASVLYGTSAGTAAAGVDYSTTIGNLTWASGDASSRTISIPIINNTAINSLARSFTINLTGVNGSTLGSINVAAISFLDDDRNSNKIISEIIYLLLMSD